jgi:hypothetical protein
VDGANRGRDFHPVRQPCRFVPPRPSGCGRRCRPRTDDRALDARVGEATVSAARASIGAAPRSGSFPRDRLPARFGAMGGGGLPRLAAPRGVGDRWPDSPKGAGVERSSCQRFAAGGHRGRAGSPDRDEKGLEGERSPWKDGVQFRRQRRGLGHQLGCGATPRSRRNGTGATTAVTRQGCDRVMFFEGCEPRRGDRYGVRAGSKDLVPATGARETRRTPRSAAGCNKPARSERSKPARPCETARSEQDRQAGCLSTDAARRALKSSFRGGSRRSVAMSMEGGGTP